MALADNRFKRVARCVLKGRRNLPACQDYRKLPRSCPLLHVHLGDFIIKNLMTRQEG
jgi:hypothetical protein